MRWRITLIENLLLYDNTYIVRNEGGITIENLSTRFQRNDIKKSVAYESDYLNGTAPSYEAIMGYKKYLQGEIK